MKSQWHKKQFKGSPAIFNEDGLVAVFEIEDERDVVLNMIDALIEAHKAIGNADDMAFGFAEEMFGNKLVKYPMKDELLNKIEQVLTDAGCSNE